MSTLKKLDFNYWVGDPSEIVDGADEVIQTWKLNFSIPSDPSYTVGGVWVRRGDELFLVDHVRDVMNLSQMIAALRLWQEKWPLASHWCFASFEWLI